MTDLYFNSAEEFEKVFKQKNKTVTDAIVLGIREAMSYNKPSAQLFSITFEGADNIYEMSLPQDQWITALEAALKHYHQLGGCENDCIDTWQLLQDAKDW
jgi:hypothetical protein